MPEEGTGLSGAGEAVAATSIASKIAALVNTHAPAAVDEDFFTVAASLGVQPNMIRAVRKVEAPRGAFDDQGHPVILYEKHVFSRNTIPKHRFDASYPILSHPSWQPGSYGPLSKQYDKLAAAAELDFDAAFKACSWGAFQVLGENAVALGYASSYAMALELSKSEAAHLDCFARFVRTNGLLDAFRACRPGDPASCIPFVRAYNGPGYAQNHYHDKLAEAAK